MKKNKDVEHQYVKIYCTKNKFTQLPFCGTHNKPHVVRGKNKALSHDFSPKIGHRTCTIHLIPCVCLKCTYTLYQ